MSLRTAAWGTTVLAVIAVFGGLASGQQQQRSATMDDLLREMRGLRADLRETAAASMRVQALVARVGLQEQRLKALSLQLNQANSELERVTRDRAAQEQRLAHFDQVLAGGSQEREEVEAEIARLKVGLSRLQERETEAQDRAHQLFGLVSTEQGRWEELNSRLDALDQLLEKPRGVSPP